MTGTPRFKRALRWAAMCGLLLLVVAEQALALGLGRIDVRSRAGEPLLAEIQVISSDASELDQLRARLASPDTFRRIGLEAPDAVVAGLEFTVALDARGNPVIRVTTREPVTQPALTFLVEVDWGQGRLVREYSALVDAPHAVAGAPQPGIEAPRAGPSNLILREPVASPADVAGTRADAGPADSGSTGPEAARAEEQAPLAAAEADPVPGPAAAPAPVAASPATAATGGEYGPVRAGETLGTIAQGLVGDGVSREQAIVALFRANPQAFISGNLNLVREGAVLRIPERSEIAGLDAAESRALMREQIAAWRGMSRPAPQPGAMAADDAVPTGVGPPGEAATAAGEVATAGTPSADARLEIVPPSASGARQAGTRSGIQAGGEGEMLRREMQQELQQNQETLAAREAEVAELRARVADLERLQAQQAQLIELKDSELAAVQDRLGSASAVVDPAPHGDSATAGIPWAWIGFGLLLAAVAAWWLVRRAAQPAPRPRFATEPAPATADAAAETPAPAPSVPGWHASHLAPGATRATPAVPQEEVPHEQAPPAAAAVAPSASAAQAADGNERIELARAYLDLGDLDTARDLLEEVARTGGPEARLEANRLLEGIA